MAHSPTSGGAPAKALRTTPFDDWLAEAAALRERRGLTRRLTESDGRRPLLDLASNDYLGLARHRAVIEGSVAATRRFGAGARASRLVSGTLSLHTWLEAALAEFTGFESALVFSTGYHANLAAVQSLVGTNTLVISDAHIHASMIDAVRLARGALQVVPHNDSEAVRLALANRHQPRAVVLAETIYSVLGDAAPIEDLAKLCDEYDALLIADEAHALGVVGPGGRGILASLDLTDRSNVVATGTLSKSFGSQGGLMLATARVREHVINTARPFIYDTGLAPAAAGGALAAIRVLESTPTLTDRAIANARVLAEACGTSVPAGAVLSVPMPSPESAVAAVEVARRNGLRIGCFRPPSTPDGVSRLRLTAHADHQRNQMTSAANVLAHLAC